MRFERRSWPIPSLDSILLVGLSGGTASGKTTIAREVVTALGSQSCLLVSHDRYYFDVVDPLVHNYDHPQALDSGLLAANLSDLKAGRSTGLPVYDFRTHTRQDHVEVVQPAAVVLVEGILVLSDPRLWPLFDLSIYVEADEQVRLERRVARDMRNRGRTRQSVLERYAATVSPMHKQFVAPSRERADFTVSGESELSEAVKEVLQSIRGRLPAS
ncbi:MAG: uridine kinase [Myxococcota bacterium]|nr:uridine kinase [Myxococcota bacterium]